MEIERAFDEYHDGLFRYLVRLTGDADLAADAAQEAFVRYTQRPPRRFDNVRAWLYTVGTNFAYDTMKVRRRRVDLLDEAPERAPVGEPALPPDESVERAERRRVVQRGLDELRDKERQILLMRADGFSYREIAATVGMPVNSIGATAARALRKLAAVLQPYEAQLP